MLSKKPDLNQNYKAWLLVSSELYSRAATALYPDSTESLEKDIKNTRDEMKAILADKKRVFYFVRNCKDLSDKQSEAGAILELLIQ
jgi:hypothetical protein